MKQKIKIGTTAFAAMLMLALTANSAYAAKGGSQSRYGDNNANG